MTELDPRGHRDPEAVRTALVRAVADELEYRAAGRRDVAVQPAEPLYDRRTAEAREANRASIRNALFVFVAVVTCACALIVVKTLGWIGSAIPAPAQPPAATASSSPGAR